MNTAVNTTITIAGYQLTEILYNGSKTIVYRGISPQQSVVIKLLQREYPNFNELLQFRNQYTIAKNLEHSGIIRPYSLELYRNAYALIMEDCGGISLRDYVREHPLALTDFLEIALQLADILHHLYHHHIIHKDIKPANILIHPETKQIKLIDFSIASLLPKETTEIKNPNVLEGTLAYLAPEQTGRMNRGIDYRADFYALGVTFFELLTGEQPFVSNDPMELVHCHIAKQPNRSKIVQAKFADRQSVPPVLAEMVMKLMAKNAEDRYQSALGLKHDLEICWQQFKANGKIEEWEIGQKDAGDRFLIPEKLYGREAEVTTLLAAFDRVANNQTELMLVAGFSGIGKTAIVNEVHKPIVRQRGYFIKGKFDQFNRNIPFSAFVQAFRDLVGQLLSESDAQLAAWKTKILSALGENGQIIIEVIPELEHIIGAQPATNELSGTALQNRFNLLFQKFIQVFTTKEHPLAVFLDDLQWADLASLKLMQLLMNESEQGYLLLIGAYRDNEVFPAHPLILTIEEIAKTQAKINKITLTPLSQASLNQLVADTFKCSLAVGQPLTQLVYQKTQGNPFFATQFLKALQLDGLIQFDWESRCWQCDIAQIKTLALSDDVVEFMALQLQKLSPATQTILKWAACIGNQFDLATLAIVSEQSENETATTLWKALQEGLILPQSEVYKFYVGREIQETTQSWQTVGYKFLHDRVQQAAYSLIPDAEKQVTHLKIGQLLLSHSSVVEREEKLFEIVNQLNMGKSLIDDLCQQTELAQLNLKAGQKARSATAYSAAFEYFTTGIDLLAGERWQTQYDLTLALYEAATEAAYLSGNFSEMTKLATTVLERANTLLDRVKVYQVEIQAAQAQTQPAKAIQIALQILRELGISFPEQPNGEDIGQALQKTLGLVAGRPPLDLIGLPEMTDATQLAIMAILAGVTASAYVAAPTLLPLIMLKQVELSLQYGNSSFSPDGYCGCGIILCGIVGDINYGYQFGQLALLLLEKLDDRNLKARTYGQVNCCISHWKDSLSSTLPLFREGYEIGLETGDLEWGGICAVLYLMHAWFAGKELNDLSREGAAFCSQFAQLKQGTMSKQGGIFHQAVWNLLGNETEAWQLHGEIFNQAKDLPVLLESGNQTAPCYFYVSKLLLSYLFGQIEEAIAASSALESYLGGATGMSLIPVFHTYDSLTHLANYCQVSEPEQEQILARVTANQEKLKNWAEASPVNQLHKFHLVAAEQYRVLGNKLEAMENYDLAISLAQENKYLNEEAIANELAAKFYLTWGKEKVAAGYMQEAYYCYARWGAKAKTDDLEQRHSQLLQPILQQQRLSFNPLETIGRIASHATQSYPHTSSSNSISDALDFASALKAAQLISRKIQLDELTASLTKIILENAGAKKCALILPNDNEWQVQAITTLIPHENLTTTTIPCQPLDDSQDVPVKLIQYVKRKLEPLVIDNCQTKISGVIGNYMQQHQPKSALCLPILNQGHLVGIIYLENRLTQGVFTSDRLEVINFLCTQAGISLENARLYQQAQQALENLQQAQLQIVQSEKMSALGNLVAGVAHEINNPVGFIGGNIDPALDYIKDIFGLIDLYRQEYPQPKAIIQDKIEIIDLEYVQSDLPKLINSMKLGINRITEISTSLRTFSRADRDYKVPCHLHEGIDSTILILKHRLKANDNRPPIVVVTEYGDLPPIECFPGQLNQVFMNLLANAIDALEESNQYRSYQEIEANPNQITIKTFLADSQVKISIADNGKGMTAEVKERIFDHLFTTKSVGKGTGLGLAIARQIIVEKHGGAIAVNSTPGEGTEFILTLPIY